MKLGGKTVAFILLFVALALITFLGAQFPARLDFTAENIYTLSPGTRKMLGKLEEQVTFKYYFSRSNETGEVDIQLKNYASQVEQMLRQFVSAGHGKIRLEVIDPEPDTDEETEATRAGIKRTPLPNGESLYFGLVVTQGTEEKTIAFFDPRRAPFLEYDIAQLVYSVQQLERPKLGLISSLPLQGSPMPMPGQEPQPDQMSLTQWQNTYEVVNVEESATELPAGLDVLAVVHPQNVSEKLQFAIDQFLLSGKPVILAVDPSNYYLRATQRSNPMMQQQPQISGSNLPKLLVSYGITFDPSQVVGDPEGALASGNAANPSSNPTWMNMDADRFNQTLEPTSNLKSMWLLEAGSFSVASDRGYEVTPLIETSDRAGTIQAMMLSFMQPGDISKQFKSEGGKRTIAAVIRGKFKSAFPLGAPKDEAAADADKDNPTDTKKTEEAKADEAKADAKTAEAKPALTESTASSSLVVIADTDWLLDYCSVQRIPQLNAYMPRNDNLAFSSNIVDYLAGSEDLIGIRSKGRTDRPFAVIQKMESAAQERYQASLAEVDKRLSDITQKLNKLVQEQNSQQELVATPEMADAIAKIREQQAQAKAEKRAIRRQLRVGIEHLENWLTVFNVLLVPAGIILLGVVYFVSRQSRRKSA